jgi:hypothetical protein
MTAPPGPAARRSFTSVVGALLRPAGVAATWKLRRAFARLHAGLFAAGRTLKRRLLCILVNERQDKLQSWANQRNSATKDQQVIDPPSVVESTGSRGFRPSKTPITVLSILSDIMMVRLWRSCQMCQPAQTPDAPQTLNPKHQMHPAPPNRKSYST